MEGGEDLTGLSLFLSLAVLVLILAPFLLYRSLITSPSTGLLTKIDLSFITYLPWTFHVMFPLCHRVLIYEVFCG